jgi:putative DNA primase/helicase
MSSGAAIPVTPKLPDGLSAHAQWVLWRYEERTGKLTKVPYQVNGKKAKTDDPRTWNRFDAVMKAWRESPERYQGIGFVFAETDPFSGIDLDACIDQAGELKPWAGPILEPFADSYREVSPSGRGIKIWVKARLDGPGRRASYEDGAIEIYDRRRFFTATGNLLNGAPLMVVDHQADVIKLYSLISKGTHPSPGKADITKDGTIAPGQRFDFLRSAAGRYRARGMDRAGIYAALSAINKERCSPPKADAVVRELADWAGTLDPGTHKGGHEAAVSVKELADAVSALDRFAKSAGGRLYVFRDGVYRPSGESVIKQRVKTLLNDWGKGDKWTARKATEACEYIRVDAPELWEAPPREIINVTNGLLNVSTRQLKPHSPEFLSPIQLPVAFNPGARCPAWDKFISEVFPEDSEAIAWEIPAWMMTADTSIQKAILLTGEGANGKSTYLRGVVAFIGKQNTAAVSLHKLEQDRFAAARLLGRLANVCPDLPTAHLAGSSMFKALTGGDVVNAEFKYGDSFEFVPFAKLVFSANQPPRSDDATHGFFRRWQVVPFTRTFEDGAAGTVPREELDERLSAPEELSGVLNKALAALAQIRKSGFSESESMRKAWQEFRTATDPLSVWLDRHTVDTPAAVLPKADLLRAYNQACDAAGRAPMTKTGFGRALRRARPDVHDAQRTVGDRVADCYTGIGLRVPEHDGGDA